MKEKIKFPDIDLLQYDTIVDDILPELFHSDYMASNSEQYRRCPTCEFKSEEFDMHSDLARHIVDYHPEVLNEYANSLSYMVEHPLFYFSYPANRHGIHTCVVCGDSNLTDTEFNQHILTHKAYFNDIIQWLRDRAKEK